MIIGIAGKAKAGKDLLYSIAAKEGWEKLSFASTLKNIVKEHFGLEEAHVNGPLKDAPCERLSDQTPRQLMIDLGNLYRSYVPDYWVSAIMGFVEQNSDKNYMITDVRFKNEAEAIRNAGGWLIRLERHPSRDNQISEETKGSVSETALDKYNKFDFVLEAESNKTPEDLERFWAVISNIIRAKI